MVVGLRVFKEHRRSGGPRHRDSSLFWQARLFRELLERDSAQGNHFCFVLFCLFLKKKKKWDFSVWEEWEPDAQAMEPWHDTPWETQPGNSIGSKTQLRSKAWWLTSARIMPSFSLVPTHIHGTRCSNQEFTPHAQPEPELRLQASPLFLLPGMNSHPSLLKWEATVNPMHSPRGLYLRHCNLATLSHSCPCLLSPSLILTS